MKHAIGVHKNIPDGIFYGDSVAGGIQFKHLWDATNIEKGVLLQASLQDKQLDIYKVMLGAMKRQQQWCCTSNTPLHSLQNVLIDLNPNKWISSLWKWMTEQQMTMGVPDMTLQPPFKGDRCIMDVYLEHVMDNMSPGIKNELGLYHRGVIDTVSAGLQNIKLQVSTLRENSTNLE